jgi:hypothetical protein
VVTVRFRCRVYDCIKGGSTTLSTTSIKPYASSKLEMASLMPSAPSASVPYGNLFDPEMLLSSDTFSASSLLKKRIYIKRNKEVEMTNRRTAKTRAIRPTAKILLLMILLRSDSSPVGLVTTGTSSTGSFSSSSSFEHVLSTATSMSVTEEKN